MMMQWRRRYRRTRMRRRKMRGRGGAGGREERTEVELLLAVGASTELLKRLENVDAAEGNILKALRGGLAGRLDHAVDHALG